MPLIHKSYSLRAWFLIRLALLWLSDQHVGARSFLLVDREADLRRRTTPPPPTDLTLGSPTIKTCAFRRAKYVLPEAPFDCLVGANHRLPAAYHRLARANYRLVVTNYCLVGANHRLAGANEARPFAPRRARPIPARRAQVLQSTYEARRYQQPTSPAARPGWLLEKCVGRHYIYNMSRGNRDNGERQSAATHCHLRRRPSQSVGRN